MFFSNYLNIIFFALGYFLFACDKGPMSSEKRAKVLQDHIKPDLLIIFPELALIDANNQFSRMHHCAISRSVEWSSALCPVFQKSEAFTSALVQSVIQSKKELRKGFLFYAKPSLKESRLNLLGLILTINEEEPIGLFETGGDCFRSLETFRKSGIQVKPCHVWNKVEIQYEVLEKKTNKETHLYKNPSQLFPE